MPASKKKLDELADEVFEVTKLVAALRARAKAAEPDDISEAEFVVLDLLVRQGELTVGEIQKEVGVLPAQMSRLLRSLEDKSEKAFVQCSINPQDRRKVDVDITADGKAAHQRFQAARRTTALQFIQNIAEEDREVFMRILRSFRSQIGKAFKKK